MADDRGHAARTYIVGRSEATLADTVSALSGPGECIALAGDLSTTEGLRAVAGGLVGKEERLDILVNNAGSMYDAPIAEFTEEG